MVYNNFMPFITIKLLEGRSVEQKRKAAKEIAEVASKHLGAPKERIHVIFEDLKREDYAPGGEIAEK